MQRMHMFAEVSKTKKSHGKLLIYTLVSVITIVAAAILSLASYLVLPGFMFPFAELPIFAALVFLLTLVLEDAHHDWKDNDEDVAADNTNGQGEK
jgi:sterol desaturase/sphingolipid hydroxylase (fatty acid hydroxylase superfamily)